jgi:hypothetical protein
MGVHPKAHQPLGQYCVHCGCKCRTPECEDCREAAITPEAVDPYTGYWVGQDGEEISTLMFDPYAACL